MNDMMIDLTPTWKETVAICVAVLQCSATPAVKRKAEQELIRMAEALDSLQRGQGDTNPTTESDQWVECSSVSDAERTQFLSEGLPEGYETVMGYYARFNPWALEHLDMTDPEVTKRDGFWLMHRAVERKVEIVKVQAPDCFAAIGIEQVNAYPLSLLRERLEA